jgi:hypothetical protein
MQHAKCVLLTSKLVPHHKHTHMVRATTNQCYWGAAANLLACRNTTQLDASYFAALGWQETSNSQDNRAVQAHMQHGLLPDTQPSVTLQPLHLFNRHSSIDNISERLGTILRPHHTRQYMQLLLFPPHPWHPSHLQLAAAVHHKDMR